MRSEFDPRWVHQQEFSSIYFLGKNYYSLLERVFCKSRKGDETMQRIKVLGRIDLRKLELEARFQKKIICPTHPRETALLQYATAYRAVYECPGEGGHEFEKPAG